MYNKDSKWLLHKREAIREMLRVLYDEQKDTTQLLDEYYETIKELKDIGIKTVTRSGTAYLTYNKVTINTPEQKITRKQKKKNKTNKTKKSKTYNINIICEYLKSLNIKQINSDFAEFPDRKEYINTYLYLGTESETNIIKSTINYLIETQRDNNIVVY